MDVIQSGTGLESWKGHTSSCLPDRGIDELMVLSLHPCLKFKSSMKQADVCRQTF